MSIKYVIVPLCAQTNGIGVNWQKIQLSSDSLRPVWIHFLDSLNGYLLLSTDLTRANGVTHYLYYSTNGGKTWQKDPHRVFAPLRSGVISLRSWYSPYFFPSSKDRFIVYPIEDTNRRENPLWYVRSSDHGITWDADAVEPWGYADVRLQYALVHAFTGTDLLFYKRLDSNKYEYHQLLRSYDGGKTIEYLASDTTFERNMWPDTTGTYRADGFIFTASDPFHWTAFIMRVVPESDSTIYNTFFPRGLRTLVTSNGGKSWSHFNTTIPGEYFKFPFIGEPQYIQGTPYIYYFSGGGFSVEGNLTLSWDHRFEPPKLVDWNVFHPQYGINFCYSSDYGKTWKIDTTFGQRRRAFEAVQKDELWFTLPKKETGRDDDPAYILARTTDGGVSYAFDTTTLTHFEQKLDGRIITFSDPRHGWIVATGDNHKDLYILRYDANEQPKSVEDELFKGYYGVHYTLYPNPARETARLSMYKYLTLKDVSVYNVFGSEVPLGYRIDGSDIELDVRDLPIGHYTLRVKHNWGISVIPLVVMR